MPDKRKPSRPAPQGAWAVLHSTWLRSLVCVLAFFALYLLVFRPGYQVDDDITMIQLASGYLGGTPVPFLVFSNVVLGFLLNALYRLPTDLNWEILLFFAVHFVSAWCLVYGILAWPLGWLRKALAVLAVLISDGVFLLNITFTTTAAFAVIAGLAALLSATCRVEALPRRMLVFGGLLMVAGSLIRLESFLLVLLLMLPALIFLRSLFPMRLLLQRLVPVLFAVALFALFNTIYVKASPEWDAFYTYNDVRSQLQDTPRVHLANMKNLYLNVGWNFNDYNLFLNWFFPDPQLYSLSHLQFLAAHASGTERSLPGAVVSYFYPKPLFDGLDSIPYFLLIAAGWVAAAFERPLRKALPALAALLLTFLVLSLYLIWTQKVPLRVWDSFLAALVLFELFILLWTELAAPQPQPGSRPGIVVRAALPLVVCAAALTSLVYAAGLTQLNVQRQQAYQAELSDLQNLQAQGRIPERALIVSPAMGLPLVWSNPLFLELPSARYIEMGWLTFSPAYYAALREFEVQSLPAGLYQNPGVFLMVKANLRDSVVEFVADHARLRVTTQVLYTAPQYDFDSGYNNVRLFKLILQK